MCAFQGRLERAAAAKMCAGAVRRARLVAIMVWPDSWRTLCGVAGWKLEGRKWLRQMCSRLALLVSLVALGDDRGRVVYMCVCVCVCLCKVMEQKRTRG